MSSRPAWSIEWVPGQLGLKRDPVSKKTKKRKKKTSTRLMPRPDKDTHKKIIPPQKEKEKQGIKLKTNPLKNIIFNKTL